MTSLELSLRVALELLAGSRCTNFTGPHDYNCVDSGRVPFARYGSEAACNECTARWLLDEALAAEERRLVAS